MKILIVLMIALGVILFPSNVGAEEAWKLEMLGEVNRHRAQSGLPPLYLCERLSDLAAIHSLDQARRGYIGHTSSNGWSLSERIAASGYGGRGWGENVAAGYNSVDAVVAGWMASPGHRANILHPLWDHLGVGFATDDGRAYWTQNFGVGGICK